MTELETQIIPSTSDHKDEITDLINNNDLESAGYLPSFGYVALFNGTVVGYIGAHKSYDPCAVIDILVVDKSYRNYNIGTQLLIKILEILKNNKVTEVSAYVTAHNIEAIGMYKALGIELKTKMYQMQEHLDNLLNNLKER